MVKDLGIYISDDLSFEHHIRTMANQGKRMAGWVLRVFRTHERDLTVTLLKQIIVPVLEHGSILWSPTSQEV